MAARYLCYHMNYRIGQHQLPVESLNDNKIINISNVAGIVMEQVKVPANNNATITVNISRYTKGTYMIHIKSRFVNTTQKIVLQ
ncbi:MAG: T9SS type A sorting domain-containing protein [Ginsengibacter sp.]